MTTTAKNTSEDSELFYTFKLDYSGVQIYWVRVKRTLQKYRALEYQKDKNGRSMDWRVFFRPSDVFATFDGALRAATEHLSREISVAQNKLDNLKHLREKALSHPPVALGA